MPRQVPTRRRYTTRQTRRAMEELGQEFRFFDPREVHPEQRAYDGSLELIRTNWLSGPAFRGAHNLEPRGIWAGRDYQNSVFQALMHVPIFIQWINRHITTPECAMIPHCMICSMRDLSQDYWGVTAQTTPIHPSAPYVINIQLASWRSGRFYNGVPGDPLEFYRWIIEDLVEDHNDRWNETLEAMFTMSYQPYETCQTCKADARVGIRGQSRVIIEIPIQNPTARTINEEITRIFAQDPVNSPCGSADCRNQNRNKLRRLEIKAAPRVLIVKLMIYDNNGQKIYQGPTIHEQLDLTPFQQFDSVLLRYTLSSVISNSGQSLNVDQIVTSVRSHPQCANRYWNINNPNRRVLTRGQFLSNPQVVPARLTGYQVYTLMYTRDVNRENSREVRNLQTPSQRGRRRR